MESVIPTPDGVAKIKTPEPEGDEDIEKQIEEQNKKIEELKQKQRQKKIDSEKINTPDHQHCTRCKTPKPIDGQALCIKCRGVR